MNAVATISRTPGKDHVQIRPAARQAVRSAQSSRQSRLLAWIVAIAVFMPYTVGIFIGETKLTAAKIVLLVLLGPALARFAKDVGEHRRRVMASDVLATATAIWLVAAPIIVAGSAATVSVTSQALEFFGSYVIGRIFLSQPATLRSFCKALGPIGIVLLGFAILDEVSERFYVLGLTAGLFGVAGAGMEIGDDHVYRAFMGHNFFRATATLDHPILYGSFCCCAATIQLFTEPKLTKRVVYTALLFIGCFLSMSSAPLIAFLFAIAMAGFDAVLKRYPLRWRLLTCLALGGFGGLSLASDNPFTWFIRNLTLDPHSGYFRLMIWDAAFEQIGKLPIFGNGFAKTGNYILDATVDCLWLARAINYGLPLIVFFLLAIVCALVPVAGQARSPAVPPELRRVRAAFSIMLVLMLFTSFTVYFWNGMWVFLCMCIGIRVSLKEMTWFAIKQKKTWAAGTAPHRVPAINRELLVA